MRLVRLLVFGIPLGLIISGSIHNHSLALFYGMLGMLVALQLSQLPLWQDPEDRVQYILPTYKKRWDEKKMRQYLVVFGIPLAMIVGGLVLHSSFLSWLGVLGVLTSLGFTQLNRWKDPEQTEMYTPTYKKEWGDKKKRGEPD
jgi:hypothetical protein